MCKKYIQGERKVKNEQTEYTCKYIRSWGVYSNINKDVGYLDDKILGVWNIVEFHLGIRSKISSAGLKLKWWISWGYYFQSFEASWCSTQVIKSRSQFGYVKFHLLLLSENDGYLNDTFFRVWTALHQEH